MSYISHEDYKSLMSKFQANTPKAMLKEAVEEGNAFTAALAKTPKGGETVVGGKKIKDTSGYDDPTVKEDAGEGRLEKIARALKDNYGMTKQEVYDTLINKQDTEGPIAQAVVDKVFGMEERKPHRSVTGRGIKESGTGDAPIDKMSRKEMIEFLGTTEEEAKGMSDEELRDAVAEKNEDMKEGLHMPPLQATGPTVDVTEDENDKPNLRSPEEAAKVIAKKHPELATVTPWKSFQSQALNAVGQEMLAAGFNRTVISNLLSGYGYFEDWVPDYLDTLSAELKSKDTVKENSVIDAPFGVAHPGMKKQLAGPGLNLEKLTSDERKQLGEFVEAVKTTKKAIEELLKKASGKQVKVKEGGNTTDKILTTGTVSEDLESTVKAVERIEELVSNLIRNISASQTIAPVEKKGLASALRELKELVEDLGYDIEFGQAQAKHDLEKKAGEAAMGQYDPH